jgi:Tfp pilus assembly protein PilV
LTLWCTRKRSGFTLIEVIGALLIFSTGVLMMLGLTRSLSQSMEHSALNSLITAEGQERLDSLSALTYATLTTATLSDTIVVRGVRFRRAQTVSQCPCTGGSGSPLVKRLRVVITPVLGSGPTFAGSSYISDIW